MRRKGPIVDSPNLRLHWESPGHPRLSSRTYVGNKIRKCSGSGRPVTFGVEWAFTSDTGASNTRRRILRNIGTSVVAVVNHVLVRRIKDLFREGE